jgi:SAM-dependent methyltransferase
MSHVLFYLPGIIHAIPIGGALVDIGAGPTIYVPLIFRHRVDRIYSADYASINRHRLIQWWTNDGSSFDWTAICKWLAKIEDNERETPVDMQRYAREKMGAIVAVDVLNDRMIFDPSLTHPTGAQLPNQFDVIVTIFCLEYATETTAEYRRAVRNALRLLKPGGYLVQGGVLNARQYSFGGKRFRCHCLSERELVECLRENDMHIDRHQPPHHFRLIIRDDTFVLCSRKHCASEKEEEKLPAPPTSVLAEYI